MIIIDYYLVVNLVMGIKDIKGKEYFNGKLIFEGEYKNEKRNGKGKEYDYYTKKIIFDGEYIDNKRNGIGKEYDKNGVLRFKGEFKEGKKWNGKGYNNKGKIDYIIKNCIR